MTPVRRHLPAGVGRIVLRADRREEHLGRGHAERQAERAVAVVGEEPVIARTQVESRRDENCFMAGAADLEERLTLILELYLLVVHLARQEHQAVRREELVSRQPP